MLDQKLIPDFTSIGFLNYQNHQNWFERVKDCLALNDLWIYLCGNNQSNLNDAQTIQAHSKIKAILKMGVDDRLKSKLESFDNASEAYNYLKKKFESRIDESDLNSICVIEHFKLGTDLVKDFDLLKELFDNLKQIDNIEDYFLAKFCTKISDDKLRKNLMKAGDMNEFKKELIKFNNHNLSDYVLNQLSDNFDRQSISSKRTQLNDNFDRQSTSSKRNQFNFGNSGDNQQNIQDYELDSDLQSNNYDRNNQNRQNNNGNNQNRQNNNGNNQNRRNNNGNNQNRRNNNGNNQNRLNNNQNRQNNNGNNQNRRNNNGNNQNQRNNNGNNQNQRNNNGNNQNQRNNNGNNQNRRNNNGNNQNRRNNNGNNQNGQNNRNNYRNQNNNQNHQNSKQNDNGKQNNNRSQNDQRSNSRSNQDDNTFDLNSSNVASSFMNQVMNSRSSPLDQNKNSRSFNSNQANTSRSSNQANNSRSFNSNQTNTSRSTISKPSSSYDSKNSSPLKSNESSNQNSNSNFCYDDDDVYSSEYDSEYENDGDMMVDDNNDDNCDYKFTNVKDDEPIFSKNVKESRTLTNEEFDKAFESDWD